MTLIHCYQGRGLTRDITIQDTDGTTIVPGINDNVRAIIGREGETAQLTITGGTATVNGSSFTKNSPSSGLNRLRLDASDLAAIEPGTWSLYIDYFDRADGAEWKNVDRQVLSLERT